MFKLFKSSSNELKFSHFHDSNNINNNVYNETLCTPIINIDNNKIPFYKWMELHYDMIYNIYNNVIKDMYTVIAEGDIPIKLNIDKNLLFEILAKKIYKTSYNTSKSWVI